MHSQVVIRLGASSPNEGSRNTLARIALQEVQDEYTVSDGNQTRKLWGRGGAVAFVRECNVAKRIAQYSRMSRSGRISSEHPLEP